MLTAVCEVSVDLQSSNLIGSVLVSTGKSKTDASIVAVSIVSQHSATCDSLHVKAEFQYMGQWVVNRVMLPVSPETELQTLLDDVSQTLKR